MLRVLQETNIFLESSFRELETLIPAPEQIVYGDGYALRYRDKRLEIAIVQKLARYISGLNAAFELLGKGYTQEIGALFRMLDEFGEDITFLALPLMRNVPATKTHSEYLEYFFQEEFDNENNAILSSQNRPTVPRRKIWAEISNAGLAGLNPSDHLEVLRTISQAYSGYVHGASCHIIEMIVDPDLKYWLSGMPNTYRQREFLYNFWDYSYRGIVCTNFAAKALGSASVDESTKQYLDYFEKATGDTGKGDPEALMKKAKKKNA